MHDIMFKSQEGTINVKLHNYMGYDLKAMIKKEEERSRPIVREQFDRVLVEGSIKRLKVLIFED